jgi:hypothetical protein
MASHALVLVWKVNKCIARPVETTTATISVIRRHLGQEVASTMSSRIASTSERTTMIAVSIAQAQPVASWRSFNSIISWLAFLQFCGNGTTHLRQNGMHLGSRLLKRPPEFGLETTPTMLMTQNAAPCYC